MSTPLSFFKSDILPLKHQNAYLLNHPKKKLIFIIGFLCIILWQVVYVFKPCITEDYRRKETTGLGHENAKYFVYFFYYLNLFPVATSHTPLVYSKKGAEATIKEHGSELLMEWRHWSRLGESARIFLYMPKAILSGSPANPDTMPFNALLFVFSLLLIYMFFWKFGKPLFGFFIVVFFGSNPFILYETYARPNVFAFLAINTLLLLALNLPFFKPPSMKKFYWILPLVSGLLIGTAVHIRGENSVLIASCLFIYTTTSYNWPRKFLLCILCLLAFSLTTLSWKYYFDTKFQQAYALVSKAGGVPYDGVRGDYHPFWHPFFCGLGDYDTKYNYQWRDTVAYVYALPILKKKYNLNLHYTRGYALDDYYDKQKKYYVKLESLQEYQDVLKQKILYDIKHDPLWYLQILGKRIVSVFKDTSPIWLKIGKIELHTPLNGIWVLPFMLLFWRWKKWFEFRLLLFSLPLATTSILLYSKGNTTYNSCFHLFFAALLASWLIEFIFVKIIHKKTPLHSA
jgi:hypothetical protein